MTYGDPEGRIFIYPTLIRILNYLSCSPLDTTCYDDVTLT